MTENKDRKKQIAWEEYKLDKDSNIDDFEDDDEEESEWEDKEVTPTLIMGGQPQQIPKEMTNPFKYFRCHKCNTNFNVTMNMLTKVEEVDGVELIIPLTRYSFIIAIAKLFAETDVKESVGSSILHGELVK